MHLSQVLEGQLPRVGPLRHRHRADLVHDNVVERVRLQEPAMRAAAGGDSNGDRGGGGGGGGPRQRQPRGKKQEGNTTKAAEG